MYKKASGDKEVENADNGVEILVPECSLKCFSKDNLTLPFDVFDPVGTYTSFQKYFTNLQAANPTFDARNISFKYIETTLDANNKF